MNILLLPLSDHFKTKLKSNVITFLTNCW